MTVKSILITRFGEVTEIDINPNEIKLEVYFKNIGVSQCKELNQWEDEDGIIYLYGYTSGRESRINKHELPPPVDMNLFFGDLLVLKKTNNKVLNFTKKDYKKFWNNAFGGFENLDDTINEDEEEEYGDDDEYDYSDSFIEDDRENIN